MSVTPGSLVTYREREWVVLPSDEREIIKLRPIGGSARETCGVLRSLADLIGYSMPFERIKPAQFPLPDPDNVQDLAAVRLTMESARLLLREGAAPFRSLGHLSVRPRPYQFVPLLMALRLETARLLISDDVGVGKTIEAALIARELLDRGEVRRIAVLCPPYLCDQWQRELEEKFHIDAVVIRSGTVSRLERQKPPDVSIFQHYRHFVTSIDLVKGENYKRSLLTYCPELVIIDEVHGAAEPPGGGRSRSRQQRHELLKELAKLPDRHLVMLTATPHSGVEDSFLSILGLLKPEFRSLNLSQITQAERIELARCFVQRRRGDVKRWLGQDTPFPERDEEDAEQPYSFSPEYQKFYESVYDFASEMVTSAETLTGWKKRMRFWSALALLRCVTSSPAAAKVALLKRSTGEESDAGMDIEMLDSSTDEELDAAFEPSVYDPLDIEAVVDAPPSNVFDTQDQDPDWKDSDRRRLRQFARTAEGLHGDADRKLTKLVNIVRGLLSDGYNPIVWCRYIATADYAAKELQSRLEGRSAKLRVASVTGAISGDERRLIVEDLGNWKHRVLVATDCLSEGINLQEHFNAVVHYDLPWNPNRLEQREGRVDRFGQRSPKVKAVMIFGQNNPVDGAVLDVLLRKAREIRRDLGIHVPVPADSNTVMEVVLSSILSRGKEERQLELDLGQDARAAQMIKQVHEGWTRDAQREKESRTRFAQHSIRPEEVEQQLEETDTVLGDPDDVHSFLLEAGQRLGFGFRSVSKDTWEMNVSDLPPPVQQRLGDKPDPWRITFDSPGPEGVSYIGRNHHLVESLAEHLLDMAFHPTDGQTPVARCGVIRSEQVMQLTTLLLLRFRYLVYERRDDVPNLAEETLVWGFEGLPPDIYPLPLEDAQKLLDSAQPSGNVPNSEKQEILGDILSGWDSLQADLRELMSDRSQQLWESHRDIRRLVRQRRVNIDPQAPPDLLGIVVLMPVPRGVR